MRLRSGKRRGAERGDGRPDDRPDTTAAASGPAVELRGVQRRYGRGAGAVHALAGVDLALPRATFTAVMGPSGSGKSTFLQCAAGLDRPTAGSVRLGGTEITGMRENELTELRRDRLGFVFQAFNLLPSLTVEQNVLLPMRLAGRRGGHGRASAVLAQVGLAGMARRRPAELSGGQQQRVAVARALVTAPDVVFADEPTGALDTGTAAEVLGLLRHAVDALGATVVMVTHDPAAAAWADRVLFLADGAFADRLERGSAERIAARMAALTARSAGARATAGTGAVA
ncbi:ABC transporter ATP-binding protein [Streptomyces sp. NRRL F-5126]|uniref:ABC transporter ATP-binding protein n=1 Tax=Streptomyces sp. NRRL F-5126 TaxID=1463857 RepID=UPI0004CBCD20|nr:ABC transporter ATP-binding protein [Streptomyces sp. NRRL F-5126]